MHFLLVFWVLICVWSSIIGIFTNNCFFCRDFVPLGEVTTSALVSLSTRDDIFSLVSEHAEYSYGELTELHYDLEAAEHEATLKFIGLRGQIKIDESEIPFYTFQEDFNLYNQLEVLAETQVYIAKARTLFPSFRLLK